jgi:hypothetical protein
LEAVSYDGGDGESIADSFLVAGVDEVNVMSSISATERSPKMPLCVDLTDEGVTERAFRSKMGCYRGLLQICSIGEKQTKYTERSFEYY